MRATLSFKLPQEEQEHSAALKAQAMQVFLFQFGQYITRKYKHDGPAPDMTAEQEYEHNRLKFLELIHENGLSEFV